MHGPIRIRFFLVFAATRFKLKIFARFQTWAPVSMSCSLFWVFKQRMFVAVYWPWSLKMGQISCYVPLVQDYQHALINSHNFEDLKNSSLFLLFYPNFHLRYRNMLNIGLIAAMQFRLQFLKRLPRYPYYQGHCLQADALLTQSTRLTWSMLLAVLVPISTITFSKSCKSSKREVALRIIRIVFLSAWYPCHLKKTEQSHSYYHMIRNFPRMRTIIAWNCPHTRK